MLDSKQWISCFEMFQNGYNFHCHNPQLHFDSEVNLFNVLFWKSSLKINERKVDKMEGCLFFFIVIVRGFYFLFQPIIINLGPTWSLAEHNFLDLRKSGLLLSTFLEHKANLAAKNLYWCNIKVLMIIKVYQNIILIHLIP